MRLTNTEHHHLKAAEGWLELGLLNEAFAELDNIQPKHQAHPDELKRTQEAYDNLAKVSERFKGEHILHYNTACYLTQLGRLDEARTALKHALVLNPEQRLAAINDPDLKPLRDEIQRRK